jgi:hypothetical protein
MDGVLLRALSAFELSRVRTELDPLRILPLQPEVMLAEEIFWMAPCAVLTAGIVHEVGTLSQATFWKPEEEK